MSLCFLFRGKLTAHVDGELGPWWTGRVEAHLANCDRCRTEVTEIRRLDSSLMVEESELGGDPEAQRLLARLHAALDRPGFQRSLPPFDSAPTRSWAVPAMASGLAMAACLALFVNTGVDPARPELESAIRHGSDAPAPEEQAKRVAPAAPVERDAAWKLAARPSPADPGGGPALAGARADRGDAPATQVAAAPAPAAAVHRAPLPLETLMAEMEGLMVRVEKTGGEVLTTVARAREQAIERTRELAARPTEEDPWSEN